MSAMTLEQKKAVAKAIHEGLYRNGTVVMYSGAFERIVENAIDAHLTAHAQMVEKVREVIELLRILPVNRKVMGINDKELANKLAAAIGDAK